MPKEKPFKNTIQGIYKTQCEDIALFFWVQAITNMLPAITESRAVDLFLQKYDIDWDANCAKVIYCQIKRRFLKSDLKCLDIQEKINENI